MANKFTNHFNGKVGNVRIISGDGLVVTINQGGSDADEETIIVDSVPPEQPAQPTNRQYRQQQGSNAVYVNGRRVH